MANMDDDELNLLQAIINLEEIEAVADVRREYNRFRRNPFEIPDKKFIRLFRLTKDLARHLIEMLREHLIAPTRRSALTVETKVFIALRFFAAGGYQMDEAVNKYCDVSQSSVSRAIHEVISALNSPEIFNSWVKFPADLQQLDALRNEFYLRHNLPGVVGCVDCTHIAIVPPSAADPLYPEHIYVNRKNYHSINTQIICDARLKILNINARYPGSTNDAFIWNASNAKRTLESIHQRGYNGYFLLGDSGYPLRTFCLTPFENALPNSPEARYNTAQRSVRSLIERCNGLLKMRFRCLLKHRVLHYKPNIASLIINSCAVLHNMCIHHNVPDPEGEEGDENMDFGIMEREPFVEQDVVQVDGALLQGRAARQRIVNNYFA